MRLPRLILAAALAAALSVAFAAPGQAQNEGQIVASSYVAIPPGATIAVALSDNSDANLEIKSTFEQELRTRGYRVAERAPFTLSFWLTGTYDTGDQFKRRGLLELGAEGGSNSRVDTDVEARVNLFSTEGGGLFQSPDRSARARSSTRYRLNAAVKEEATGKRAWHGQAFADVRGGDPLGIAQAMVPPLAQNMGKTVRRDSFLMP